MKNCLFLLAFLGLTITPDAQNGRQYSFTYYNTSNGSISNQVNSVVQDEEGFIWTATTDGLQRFDGTRYRIFRHNEKDPHSLPSNPVMRVMIDGKKNLWVLLASGKIGIFDTKKFRFIESKVSEEDQLLFFSHKELVPDESGNLMLLLQGQKFLTYNAEKNEFSSEYNFISLTDSMKVIDLVHQPGTQKYWISTSAGLAIYNLATGRLSYDGFNRENEPAINQFRKLGITGHYYFDRKGRLWFDTWVSGLPAIYAYNTRTNSFDVFDHTFQKELKAYYEIHGFFEQADGTFWVYGLGLFAKHIEKAKEFELVYNGYRNGRSIYYDAVQHLFEDREDNVWVATRNNGLFRFNPSHDFFTNVSHLLRRTGDMGSGSVLSFIHTRWGSVLAGTWGDGLFQYNRQFELQNNQFSGIDNKHGPTVWTMCLSGDSTHIWAGSQPGIYKINQSTRVITGYYPAALKNKTVRQLVEDRFGNLWIGLQTNGLYKWTKSKGSSRFDDGLCHITAAPVNNINKLIRDREGLIWVGTAASGLYVIDPATDQVRFRFHKEGEEGYQLPENGISSILDFDDSLVMISTSTEILAYNRLTKQTRDLGPSESLSGFIASMEKDRLGYLWVSTTSGLYRINIHQRIYVRFTRDDGIDNDNFTLASSYVLPDGRMLFGSSNEFIVFDPEHMMTHQVRPEVHITNFSVMNRSLNLDSLRTLDLVRLGAEANAISIEFSPLRYAVAYQVRYMLEGLDKQWKYAERSNKAIYSYLPGGTYTLRVQALNEDGQYGPETQLRIRVTPPFWKSWWFLSAVVLALAGLLYWFDKERMKRKQAIQKMRSDISGNLHSEINTALNNINILSEMARLKSGKDPVKAEEYIEQIHTKSHNMIIAMDDMLWSLDANNDNMKKTVERMREYIEAMNNRHGAYIDMLVDRNVEQLKLNMKLRHDAFLLFKEGVHNLVQTGITICHIHIGLEKQELIFTMQFDTECCDMQKLNNLFHRHDMEKRIDSMNAEMDVQVHKNNTMVLLKIPLA